MTGDGPTLDALHSVLAPMGFARSRSRWARSLGRMVDVVELERAKSGLSSRVNVGIFDPEPYRHCWPEKVPPKYPDSGSCIVKQRLQSEGVQSWPIGCVDMVEALASQAPMLFERWHAPGGVEAALLASVEMRWTQPYPPPRIYAAAYKAERGDVDGALTDLSNLLERCRDNEVWARRVTHAIHVIRSSSGRDGLSPR